jgi:peroxiredoxin
MHRLFLPALLLALLLGPPGAALARGQSLEGNPLLLDSPKEPVEALDFTARTLGGKEVRLSDFRGKVVLLNFWATWCVPCVLEMPAMERLHRRLAGRPFALLAVNQAEAREQVERFAREYRFSYPLLLDPIGEIGTHYGANRLPMSYIIDARGFVLRRAIGPREWDSPEAAQMFEQLMAPAPGVAPATAQRRP